MAKRSKDLQRASMMATIKAKVLTVRELIEAGAPNPLEFLMEVMGDDAHVIDTRVKAACKLTDVLQNEQGTGGSAVTIRVGPVAEEEE